MSLIKSLKRQKEICINHQLYFMFPVRGQREGSSSHNRIFCKVTGNFFYMHGKNNGYNKYIENDGTTSGKERKLP